MRRPSSAPAWRVEAGLRARERARGGGGGEAGLRSGRRGGAGLRARAAGEPPPPSEAVRATGAGSFLDGSDVQRRSS